MSKSKRGIFHFFAAVRTVHFKFWAYPITNNNTENYLWATKKLHRKFVEAYGKV